jgi:DNA polymerase III subunit epsilon
VNTIPIIHGIAAADVQNQPEFPDIWPKILEFLQGKIVLAHNASFDFSVLRNTLTEYGIVFPEIIYGCTRLIAKAVWPGLIRYKLTAVARLLGIEFQHHDAMADAHACLEIADRACRQTESKTLVELANQFGLHFGEIHSSGEYSPPYGILQSIHNKTQQLTSLSTKRSSASLNSSVKVFAFTGTLRSMERKQAMQLVLEAEGQPEERVTKQTNFLVVGDQDYRHFAEGQTKSSKMRKAESLLASGQDIEIISEEDFLQMIGHSNSLSRAPTEDSFSAVLS